MPAGETTRLLPTVAAGPPAPQEHHGFSIPVGVAFSLNYIMGTGFLTLPWAFSRTGYLSFLVMAVIIVPSLVAVVMLLEAMSRAEKYTDTYLRTEDGSYTRREGAPAESSPDQLLRVRRKKFEVIELCNMFLGPLFQMGYLAVLCVYMFGTLWAYTTVFAKGVANTMPDSVTYSYYFCIALFGAFVLPLSCLDLKEQVSVQMVLAGGRVLMVVFMVGTVAASALWGSPEDFGRGMRAEPGDEFAFDFQGLHHLLPIATFANILHHSIPALSEPVREKKRLSYMFSFTLLCCFVAYSAIALSVSSYFGSHTLSSSNLNWSDYGKNCSGLAYALKRAISTYVVMFPALDVASAFPLNAITLGNNLFSVVFGVRVHGMEGSRWHKYGFRLAAALPPLVMASAVSDLGRITDYTGVTGFALAFVFPPLLAYYSHTTLANVGMPVKTIYSSFYTSVYFGAGILFFGTFLFIYVPYSLYFDA